MTADQLSAAIAAAGTMNLDHSLASMNNAVDEMCAALSRNLAKQQDAAIRKAISNHLGRDDWTNEDVIPRLALFPHPDGDMQTITMDGKPIMLIGPVEMKREERGRSNYLRATRGYRILNEPTP